MRNLPPKNIFKIQNVFNPQKINIMLTLKDLFFYSKKFEKYQRHGAAYGHPPLENILIVSPRPCKKNRGKKLKLKKNYGPGN